MTSSIQLREVQKRVVRKRELTEQLKELYLRQEELAPKVEALERLQADEQSHIDKLEKKGPISFFYGAIGKKGAKLDKERKKAQMAVLRYREALQKLEHIKDSITSKELEQASLEGCEKELTQLLQEKRRLLEVNGAQAMEGILWMEQELSDIDKRRRAIQETIELGKDLLKRIGDIQNTLKKAEDAAVKQSFSGLVMDIARSNHLSKAQQQAAVLKEQLTAFGHGLEQALVDEQIHANLNVFYDFGNGIYSCWIWPRMVMDAAIIERIRTAKANMKQLDTQITNGLEQLAQQLKITERDEHAVRNKLENYVIDADRWGDI